MQIQNNNTLLDKAISIIDNGKSQSLIVFLNILSLMIFIDNTKLQSMTGEIQIDNPTFKLIRFNMFRKEAGNN